MEIKNSIKVVKNELENLENKDDQMEEKVVISKIDI